MKGKRWIHMMQLGALINREDRLTGVEIKQKYLEIFCISEGSINRLRLRLNINCLSLF